MSMKVELPARYGHSEEELAFIREMGVNYLNLNVMPDHANYDDMAREVERLAKHDIKISDLACPPLQKNASIILGKPDADEQIANFCSFIRMAAKIGAPIVSVAWQPNGILRTGRAPTPPTRGGTSFYCEQAEVEGKGILNDRAYSDDEIWANFAHFLEATVPVCEETGVVMALHPNDPPLACLGGVASLIYNTECYRRALALTGNSKALAVKMCVGCWLENEAFGDLMADIKEFCSKGQLCEVHFRNVSACLPNFSETLLEDGYADMQAIMKQLITCGFDGYISIDHAFKGYPSVGGELASMGYLTGYMKGLMHAVEYDLGLRKYGR